MKLIKFMGENNLLPKGNYDGLIIGDKVKLFTHTGWWIIDLKDCEEINVDNTI